MNAIKAVLREPAPRWRCRARRSAYVIIRQHTSAEENLRLGGAVERIRQHTSAYVSIRQHTSAEENLRLGGAVKGGGGLIQDYYRRVPQEHTRERDALTLASTQPHPSLPHLRSARY
jgi:hypothetical protein